MLYFGDKDSHIPMQGARLKAAHPRQIEHVSDTDHGFKCDQRGSWHQPSAILARARTLDFFREYLARGGRLSGLTRAGRVRAR